MSFQLGTHYECPSGSRPRRILPRVQAGLPAALARIYRWRHM